MLMAMVQATQIMPPTTIITAIIIMLSCSM
jgi:hypothetical protein